MKKVLKMRGRLHPLRIEAYGELPDDLADFITKKLDMDKKNIFSDSVPLKNFNTAKGHPYESMDALWFNLTLRSASSLSTFLFTDSAGAFGDQCFIEISLSVDEGPLHGYPQTEYDRSAHE